jgi:endoglucanase
LVKINGASGDEKTVREFIKSNIVEFADIIYEDNIGNLIAFKQAKNTINTKKKLNTQLPKKVMLAAHMDEVGFMISDIMDDGLLAFIQVGGIYDKILSGLSVTIGKNKIPGVIVDCGEHFIDIGANSRYQAQNTIEIGDFVSFESDYIALGVDVVKAKALDDRVGCSILMEILKGDYNFDLYACFTVQEEIGLRGVGVAAYNVKPDIAIVLEGTTCQDTPGVDLSECSTVMGEGPAISILDKSTYYDNGLNEIIKKIAHKTNIKIQIKNTFTGGNDSGKIQRSNNGIKVAVISVPVRYIHSPFSIISLKDYKNTCKLLEAVLADIDNSI